MTNQSGSNDGQRRLGGPASRMAGFWLAMVFLAAGAGRSLGFADDPAPVSRPSVVGRVVDVEGKPLAFVTVGLTHKNAAIMTPAWGSLRKWTRTDAQGRFSMPGIKPGEYEVLPVSGIEILGNSTPLDQIPDELREYAGKPGRHRLPRPLPAAFVPVVVSVEEEGKPAEVEIKAVPHVTYTARFIDSAGKPANARPDAYPIFGKLGGLLWQGGFDFVPGQSNTMTARVPAALKDLLIQDEHDNVWWTWKPGTPRVPGHYLRLKKLDGDRLEIVAQRYKSNILEIRLRTANGKLPGDPDVSVDYPTPFGSSGGLVPKKVAEGVYRLTETILPGRDCQVLIGADNFKDASTSTFQFAGEGEVGVVEVSLKPGVRKNEWNTSDAERVELKTLDGRPILQAVEEVGPLRSIACRVVDRSTGKPVAGAVVKIEFERRVKRDQDAPYGQVDWSDKDEVTTDAEGRFTVAIPEKSIADRTPLANTQARITIDHEKYVSYFDSVDVSELAKNALSDSFPRFRSVKLVRSRRVSGRVVDAEGKPIKDVTVYQGMKTSLVFPVVTENQEVFIPDLPTTEEDGRFAFNAPLGQAFKLEFRAVGSARKYHEVAADATDLGDIRIAPGVRVSGQVLDAQGHPLPYLNVTTPALPKSEAQPNFSETTDQQGRFRTDELPPGKYQAIVGDYFHDEQGKPTGFNSRLAPGLFVPTPFEILEGQPAPELTLRPVPHVTLTAKVVSSRPEPKPDAADDKKPDDAKFKAALNELGHRMASLGVKGTFEGRDWTAAVSYLNLEDDFKTCKIRVPKGLVNAQLDFGPVVQRFQVGPNAPELFGPTFRLAKIDGDLPVITLRRYRDTTLKLVRNSPIGKPPVMPKLHYVRESAMRDAGVVLEAPLLQPTFEGDEARLSVLPDEEIEITSPGSDPVRVKLAEGETHEVKFAFPVR